jgi:hypothetical protein
MYSGIQLCMTNQILNVVVHEYVRILIESTKVSTG